MPNPDLGEITCPCCNRTAPVRRSVKSKLYFVCNCCGMFPMAYPGGQDYMLEHATIYGPGDKPEPPADPDPVPPAAPEPQPGSEPAASDPPAADDTDDEDAEPADAGGGLEDWLV